LSEPVARAVLIQGVIVAREQAGRLLALLETEFNALRGQDLQGFEFLQTPKEELIVALGRLVQRVVKVDGTPNSPADSREWALFCEEMSRCREAHRRNDVLIRSKLQSIRAALHALQAGEGSGSLDMYDRLGRIAGRGQGRGYTEA